MHHNISKIDLQNTYLLYGISIIIIKFIDNNTFLLIFWIGLIIDGYTTVLCYTSGEIIDCEFKVYYNRLLEKGVSINNMITFDELEKNSIMLWILIVLTPS